MIGKLRHQITIQTPTRVANETGGFTQTWAAFASNLWAEIKPASARERMFADKLQHLVTHKIRIRYYASITSKMRVSFGSRTFQIHGILNDEERGIWTDLICEEGPAS